jgi:hypothetical protein
MAGIVPNSDEEEPEFLGSALALEPQLENRHSAKGAESIPEANNSQSKVLEPGRIYDFGSTASFSGGLYREI